MSFGGPRWSGWSRHLNGWRAGAVVVLAALISASLVVPHPVDVGDLPLPQVDRREQLDSLRRTERRARQALAGLPPEVQLVGEAFERAGARLSTGLYSRLHENQLRRLTRRARQLHGDEALLRLRALQSHRFVAAVRPGGDGSGAAALGGALFRAGRQRGWFDAGGFTGDERTLITLFQVHWGRATALVADYPFSPTLNDWRIYYRFLLSRDAEPEQSPAQLARQKLQYLGELAQHDATYLAGLARGILLRQAGAAPSAALALQAHLTQHPDGPWTLIARNHLAACGAAMQR